MVKIQSRKWTTKEDRVIKSAKETINYQELIHKFYKYEFDFMFEILTDLRSDLSIRLAEQKKNLESAKSEVEKNIVWTTELNQVSGLQRARLDRQIEQFEELQKVLVKV